MVSNGKQDRQRTYNVNTEVRSCNNCCRGKSINITYPECVFVALGMQYPMRMRHVISGMPGSQNFSTLPHKRHELKKKKLLNIKCVIWFSPQLLFETFLIQRRTGRDIIKMYTSLRVKCLLFLSDFNETWAFSTDFQKVLKYNIEWKSVQWEPSCYTWTGVRTDRHDEANSRFSQFCERA